MELVLTLWPVFAAVAVVTAFCSFWGFFGTLGSAGFGLPLLFLATLGTFASTGLLVTITVLSFALGWMVLLPLLVGGFIGVVLWKHAPRDIFVIRGLRNIYVNIGALVAMPMVNYYNRRR